jgi:hypothetical protein
MDSLQTVSATSNVATAAATSGSTGSTSSGDTSTTSSTSKTDKKSFSELFDDAKKGLAKGETLTHVKGHDFAQIHGGKRDERYVNLSGNARNGQAFDLVTRNGHTFHVYAGRGDGKKVVVEIKSASPATTGGTKAS